MRAGVPGRASSALQPLRGVDGRRHRSPRAGDASGTRFGSGSVTLFTLGAIVGAAITGSLVGLLGGCRPGSRRRARAGGRGRRGGLRVAAGRPGFLGLRTPTLRRQTSSTWYRERGARDCLGALGIRPRPRVLDDPAQLPLLAHGAVRRGVRARRCSLRSSSRLYGLGLGVAFAGAVVAQTRSASSGAASPGLGLLHAAGAVRLASDAFLGLVLGHDRLDPGHAVVVGDGPPPPKSRSASSPGSPSRAGGRFPARSSASGGSVVSGAGRSRALSTRICAFGETRR